MGKETTLAKDEGGKKETVGAAENPYGIIRKVSRKELINAINYLHFLDENILINLKHRRFGNTVSLPARPSPCTDSSLSCSWTEKNPLLSKLSSYEFHNILLDDGRHFFMIDARLRRMDEEGIALDLPESCHEVQARRAKRHICDGIYVQIFQGGITFQGTLRDFSGFSFRVEIDHSPDQSLQWINAHDNLTVIIRDDEGIIFSGNCKLIRHDWGQDRRDLILEPVEDNIRRFKPKDFRSSRHRLTPFPNAVFLHPITKKNLCLDIYDLSGSGLCIEEDANLSVLLPGVVIPDLTIEFANDYKIACKAQVVYRNRVEGTVRSGLIFLDMEASDHARLSGYLHKLTYKKSYVCRSVNMEELWRFFFQSGFVYPKKYTYIHTNKQRFKETYEKLYEKSPKIARHFIFQDKGIIHGHISMIRFYEHTWLIQHHVASHDIHQGVGLTVLDQIGRYVNEAHYLSSAKMNFVACYYRPDNRFPKRVFGGVVELMNDRKGSSVDPFAYFHYRKGAQQPGKLDGWSVEKTQADDLYELKCFYEQASGGLMLKALDLEPGLAECHDISKEFHTSGFKREKRLFSLKRNGELKAVFLVNTSDIGLNMSELTNCVSVIVIDQEGITREVLYSSLSYFSHYYDGEEIPVLLYPVDFMDSTGVGYENIYELWILNVEHLDNYFSHISRLMDRLHIVVKND